MENNFYTIYFYSNGDAERIDGYCLPLPCDPASIKLVVEYHGEGNIINCYNPNDI